MQFVKFIRHSICLIICLLIGKIAFQQQNTVVINEILASNSSVLADEDGDFTDWIEIYNPTQSEINLSGYGITDESWLPFKWIFPDTIIQAQSFILVFASEKNRNISGYELHLNFSVSAEAEQLTLSNPQGQIVDNVYIQNLPTDISFGRYTDGQPNWHYFDTPTPNSENDTQYYSYILNPPIFSREAGFYEEEFLLEIYSANQGVSIIYTLDGSEPDPYNLEGTTYFYKNQYPENPDDETGELIIGSYISHTYSSPILINDRSNDVDSLSQISSTFNYESHYFPENPVRKGTIVRAKAYRDGALPAQTTAIYFVNQPNETEMLTVSLNIQEDYLFDYYNGIYVAGIDFDSWRASNPSLPVYGNRPANYWRIGVEHEYEGNIMFFEPGENTAAFNQNIGIRIHGGWTRAYACKSLRLYARNKYGNSHINYDVFRNSEYSSYKRLILRNGGNDWNYLLFRDVLMQSLVKHLNQETQSARTTRVFINGEFWGIHHLRERYDHHYLERVYDVKESEIDYLTNNSLIEYGDNQDFIDLKSYMISNPPDDSANYAYIKTKVDIENFIDYQISNIFFSNRDWPRNNVDFWRMRKEYDDFAEYGQDGRYRWLLYDTDFGFGLYGQSVSHNTLEYASQSSGYTWENPLWATFMLRNLIKSEDFVIQFVNRFADLLNTTFLHARIIEETSKIRSVMEPGMQEHCERWNRNGEIGEWQNQINTMLNWAAQRPGHQRQHIIQKFDAGEEYNLNLDVSDNLHGYIRVNTIEIKPETIGVSNPAYPWSGIYFTEIPIEIEAIPYPGFKFKDWQGSELLSERQESGLLFDADVSLKAIFEPDDERMMLYYWHFNDLQDGIYNNVNSDTSFFIAGGQLSYPGPDASYMDKTDDSDSLNCFADFGAGYALRLRNPSKNHEMLVEIPTTGFEEIHFFYSYKRSTNGPRVQAVYYLSGEDEPQIRLSNNIYVTEEYEHLRIDLTEIAEANNNPDFRIRIKFGGNNSENSSGNTRIDNVLITGVPLPETNMPPYLMQDNNLIKLIENYEDYELDLNSFFADPDGDSLEFTIQITNQQLIICSLSDENLLIKPIQRGESNIIITADDKINHPAQTQLRVLVYPEAHVLSLENYVFDYWNSDSPEMSYPENIIFLQSDSNFPDIRQELLFSYFIPHSDYSIYDSHTIGFPYNNNSGSRINGMYENGISFKSEGNGRDPGSLLLALDTREMSSVFISWTAEMIKTNEIIHGIRLQYRTGVENEFSPFELNSQPLDFISYSDGELQEFTSIELPPELLDNEYIQLEWRYFPAAGSTGLGSEIRLDNIFITKYPLNVEDVLVDTEIYVYPNPVRTYLYINVGTIKNVSVYNLHGQVLISSRGNKLDFRDLQTGLYSVLVETKNGEFKRFSVVKLTD
jgi:hypothetical protein